MTSLRTASALRIFLIRALHDSERLLSAFNGRIKEWSYDYSANVTGNSCWDRAVEAALRVIRYIQNYLCHEGSADFIVYGLSAIGAAQEALVSAVSLCRGISNESLKIQLYSEQVLRAKLVANGLVAVSMRDHELASLWILASKEVHRRSELKCIGNSNDTCIPATILDLTKKYLQNASLPMNEVKEGEGKDLLQLAARHFRLAAVYTLLGRNHAYHCAAETYQQAAELSRSAAVDGTPMTLNLWQTAVASMRLAGDLIAAHSDETSAKNDPKIVQTFATAKQLVADISCVPRLVASIEDLNSKRESVLLTAKACKCRFLSPALQLLLRKMELVRIASEEYLRHVVCCDGHSSPAVELQRTLTWRKSEVADVEMVVQKLERLIQNAHNYRTNASQVSKTITHRHIRRIFRECWTKAAEQADHILQLSTALGGEGFLQAFARDLSGVWQRRHDILRGYVYIAEHVLCDVVEYLDKARGAAAGKKRGRDPRESIMWYKASEFMLQRAETMTGALLHGQSVHATKVSISDLLACTMEPFQKAERCAQAGDLLVRSEKFKQLVDVDEHALQISSVYNKLATLTIRKYTLDTDTITLTSVNGAILFEDSVLAFMFKFIEILTSSTPIASEQMSVYSRGCEYGYSYLLSIYASKDSATSWKSAFEYSFNARNILQSVQNSDSAGRFAYEVAMSSVFALGASAADQKRTYFSLACTQAAKMVKTLFKDVPFKMYRVALAERILVLADRTDRGNEALVIPAELHQLIGAEVNKIPTYEVMLQEHAEAYCLDVECEHQVNLASTDKAAARLWTDAKKEVANLILHMESRAKHHFNLVACAVDHANLLAFYKLVVPCYIEAAKHQSGSAVSDAWNKAVTMSRQVTVRHLPTSTIAIERYARAARAVGVGDLKLSALWETAAVAARLWHERTVSPHFGVEAAQCEFKHLDCHALAFVAQREERKEVMEFWKIAALKWKEAAEQCPLKVVDRKNERELIQQEIVRRLISEAEREESIAESAAQLPQDGTALVGKDNGDVVDDMPSTFPAVQHSHSPSASRLRPLSSGTGGIPASTVVRAVPPASRVAKSGPTSLLASKPSSGQQIPSRRAGSTATTTVKSAGVAASRSLSSRSAVSVSTKPTVTVKSAKTGK